MTTDWKQLTKRDISAFDKEAKVLVLEMTDAGWVGRMSSRGHAIMRAPDRKTSHCVSRDSLRGRSGRNARSVFESWKRAHSSAICDECGQQFSGPQGLGGHLKSHRKELVQCDREGCGWQGKVLAQHVWKVHRAQEVLDVVEVVDEVVEDAVSSEPETPDVVRQEPEPLPSPPPYSLGPVPAMEALLAVLTELEALRVENAQLRARLEECDAEAVER